MTNATMLLIALGCALAGFAAELSAAVVTEGGKKTRTKKEIIQTVLDW